MGDIIKTYFAKSAKSEKERKLRFLYDNGCPWTLVKESAALKMKNVFKLKEPHPFYGLGNGEFHANYIIELQIKLKGVYVTHLCYVVSDTALEKEYHALIGHDFMQRYDIGFYPKRRKVMISKSALLRTLKIKSRIKG